MNKIRFITMLTVTIGLMLWHMPYMRLHVADATIAAIENGESPSRHTASIYTAKAVSTDKPNQFAVVSEATQPHSVDTATLLQPQCDKDCLEILELLRQSAEFSDFQLEHALRFTDELAAFLKSHSAAHRELINIAIESSGNTRRLIIAAFTQLEPDVQEQLGRELIASSGKVKRLDGVQLLASTKVMDTTLIPYFEQLYASENDEHVREAIVRAFDRRDLLYGNTAALDFLTAVIHSDSSNAVRGDALLASARLSDDANFAVGNSLAAVRSQAGIYQVSGARALSEFINLHTINGHAISWQHKYDMEQLMDEIMTTDFDDMPAQARTELDNLYARFF